MTETLKRQWSADIMKHLVGRRIAKVRYMSSAEVKEFGWYNAAVVIVLDDGNCLMPASDDEGNDAGALFTTIEGLPVLPVI